MFTVARVVFDGSKKPTDALLIVVVLLALKNDLTRTISTYDMAHTHHSYLFTTVNELVAAILGEVILCQYLATVLKLFACSILVFLRNAIRQSILNKKKCEYGNKLFPR